MADTVDLREGSAPLSPAVPVAAAPSHRPAAPLAGGGLEPTLYRFILRHSRHRQLLVLAVTLASFPFYYYALDLPKTIVNRAIGGKRFPQEFLGFEFEQIPYLLVLCGIFLALVFVNGGFKDRKSTRLNSSHMS